MSYDLLDGTNAWPHYYRHVPELLFYILIWAAIHYDLKKKKQHRSHINGGKILPELTEWMAKHSKRPCKVEFLFSTVARDKIFRHIGPDFKPIQELWLEPLWDVFHGAYGSRPTKHNDPYDHVTCGGRATFETFTTAMIAEIRSH
jgi:hypothetical protein